MMDSCCEIDLQQAKATHNNILKCNPVSLLSTFSSKYCFVLFVVVTRGEEHNSLWLFWPWHVGSLFPVYYKSFQICRKARDRIFYFFLVVSAASACKGQDLGVSCTTVSDFIGEHFFSIVPRLFSSKIS